MTDLFNRVLAAAEKPAPGWLAQRQAAGRQAWLASELPTRKTEAWKYTSIRALDRDFAQAEPSAASKDEIQFDGPDLGGPHLGGPHQGRPRLVFVDGFLREDMSSMALPDGAALVHFSAASDEQARQIQAHLGSNINNDQHLFARLSDAAIADGIFLAIDADARVETPIQLVWLTTTRDQAFTVNQRLLVVAGRNSQASVVEHFASAGTGSAFTNGVTELILEDGANLDHHRLHLEEGGAMHIGGVHARLARDSNLRSFHLALGSELKRIDIVIDHQGPGAHCDLNGIYLLRGKEHVDYHTCIEHAAPHCTTDEVFRGIVGGEASAVFNGRIHIHPDAQKTRAELSNRNLLTSTTAEINTKPELEIYADDVQCAHGATVAQLDAGTLHYLKTRGIPADEAEVMLSYGFINEVVDSVRIEALREYLQPVLAKRLAPDDRLTRHLA